MTTPESAEDQLVRLMPALRVWALGMTRNTVAADDLEQDVAAKVLANQHGFIPGSNFKAWVHRIMLNHFISSNRRKRAFVSVDEIVDIPVAAEQHDKLALARPAICKPLCVRSCLSNDPTKTRRKLPAAPSER